VTVIDIQIDQYIPEALEGMFTPQMLEGVLDDLADGALNKWRRLARANLGGSREDYINGLQPTTPGPGVRLITLVGWLPNAIEAGIGSYDLRETLLGPNSKVKRSSENGTYARIPFRHKTPGASAMGGQPMGSAYGPRGAQYAGTIPQHLTAAGAREMGESIYQMAKGLRATRSGGGAPTQWGGRLPPGMAPILRPPRPEHPVPQMRRGHVTDIYAGMVRIRHKYARATQTQYMTWRTISSRVPHGWIHPGIKARNLAVQVEEWIRENAKGALLAALRRQASEGAA